MSRDTTAPDRKTRIVALSAMTLAVVGGLSLAHTANAAEPATIVTETSTVIATGCRGFAANAPKLLDKSGTAVLRGTFAPGDHVHLAIDLRDAGYSWELTGALGAEAIVTPSIWYRLFRTTKSTNHVVTTWSPEQKLLSTDYKGEINGYARWELELDVASAGDGTLTINRTSAAQPRVAFARCAPRKATPSTSG